MSVGAGGNLDVGLPLDALLDGGLEFLEYTAATLEQDGAR